MRQNSLSDSETSAFWLRNCAVTPRSSYKSYTSAICRVMILRETLSLSLWATHIFHGVAHLSLHLRERASIKHYLSQIADEQEWNANPVCGLIDNNSKAFWDEGSSLDRFSPPPPPSLSSFQCLTLLGVGVPLRPLGSFELFLDPSELSISSPEFLDNIVKCFCSPSKCTIQGSMEMSGTLVRLLEHPVPRYNILA